MNPEPLPHLARLFRQEANAILKTWRNEVAKLPSARHLSVPVLNDHIPTLLEEVSAAFETVSDKSITEALIEGTPEAHGEQRLADGFDIVEVVAEYNILRGCLHDVAEAEGLNMAGKPFHILNRVFDGAIGLAVESYATHQATEVHLRRQEYLAFVAHDLRTPLSAISLATTLLGSSVAESGEGARMVDILHRNVGRLQAMVSKVLEEGDHLRTGMGVKLERRDLDLWPLVEALVLELKPAGAEGGPMIMNTVPTALMVYADADLVRRIFQNLLGNAIAYTPLGEISIGAQVNAVEHMVECWVSDTGKGIPKELLAEVFAKGKGDDARAESTGLGLAIVKLFVEAHGGTVRAESDEGKGSTFRFTLPLGDLVSR